MCTACGLEQGPPSMVPGYSSANAPMRGPETGVGPASGPPGSRHLRKSRMSPPERAVCLASRMVSEIISRMTKVPDSVGGRAVETVRELVQKPWWKTMTRDKMMCLCACCVFTSCRRNGCSRTVTSVAEAAGVSVKRMWASMKRYKPDFLTPADEQTAGKLYIPHLASVVVKDDGRRMRSVITSARRIAARMANTGSGYRQIRSLAARSVAEAAIMDDPSCAKDCERNLGIERGCIHAWEAKSRNHGPAPE